MLTCGSWQTHVESKSNNVRTKSQSGGQHRNSHSLPARQQDSFFGRVREVLPRQPPHDDIKHLQNIFSILNSGSPLGSILVGHPWGVVFFLGLQAKPLDFLLLCFVVAFFLIHCLVGVWYPAPLWNEEGVIGVQTPDVKTVPLLVLRVGVRPTFEVWVAESEVGTAV